LGKNIRLIDLTTQIWDRRWVALTEICRVDLGIDLSVEVKLVDLENLKENIETVIKSGADACRISDEVSTEVEAHLSRTTQKATFAGACPFLVRDGKEWWPRPLLEEALIHCVTENFGQLDLDSFALVAGAGGGAKLAIASIAMLGYSTINISDKSEENAIRLVEEMKKKFFQINFQAVPFQSITTLPGVHSLVVNTTPLSLENDLLDELYFFNFLKSGGAVIDLTLIPSETPLIIEAKQWGARHLSGDYVSAERDALMIEKLTGKKLQTSKYRELLRKDIDAAPFDASPFLQRFRERGT
jgi:shikimate 5-dehydrogenase